MKHVEINISIATLLCLSCNTKDNRTQMFKLWQKLWTKVWRKIKKRFFNTYKFSSHDTNKFILLLQKGVHPYEHIDDWEKSNKASLPGK